MVKFLFSALLVSIVFLNICLADDDLEELAWKKLVIDGKIPEEIANYLISEWSKFPQSFSRYVEEFCFYYGLDKRYDYRYEKYVAYYYQPKLNLSVFPKLKKEVEKLGTSLRIPKDLNWDLIISFLPYLERKLQNQSIEDAIKGVKGYLIHLSNLSQPENIFQAGVVASFGLKPDRIYENYQLIEDELMKREGEVIKNLVLEKEYNFQSAKDFLSQVLPPVEKRFREKDYSNIPKSWRIWLWEALFEEKLDPAEIVTLAEQFREQSIDYPSRFSSDQWQYIFEQGKKVRKIAIIGDKKDHNGALLDLRFEAKAFIDHGYKVLYYEIDTLWDFLKSLAKLVEEGGVDVLLLTGHGRPYRVGDYLNILDLKESEIFTSSINDGLQKAIKPGGGIILLSCSTGSHKDLEGKFYSKNVADFLYECFPQISFLYAPIEAFHSITNIEFDHQGNVIGIEYDGGEVGVYNPVPPICQAPLQQSFDDFLPILP